MVNQDEGICIYCSGQIVLYDVMITLLLIFIFNLEPLAERALNYRWLSINPGIIQGLCSKYQVCRSRRMKFRHSIKSHMYSFNGFILISTEQTLKKNYLS